MLDTPGTCSLLPASEDERVTRDVLLSGEAKHVVAVGDAKNLERTVLLALQLCETGVPFVLCLNMMDEAAARGITIDTALLAGRLGVEVVPTVAVRGEGADRLRLAIPRAAPGLAPATYPEPVERPVERAIPLLPASPLSPRALALMVLCGGEEVLRAQGGGRLPANAPRLLEIARELQAAYREPLTYVVTQARVREAWRIVETVARHTASDAASHPWRERLT